MQDETWMKYVVGDRDDPGDMQTSLLENERNIYVLQKKQASMDYHTPNHDILELDDRIKANKFINRRLLELETESAAKEQQRWAEHVELLKSDLSSPDVSNDDLSNDDLRYAYAVTPFSKLPQLPEDKTGVELFGWIIEQLERRSFVYPPPLLLLFVYALNKRSKKKVLGKVLDHWIKKGCSIYETAPQRLAELLPNTDESVLQIAIHSKGREQYSLQGWVRLPNDRERNITPDPNSYYTREKLSEPVKQLFEAGRQNIPIPHTCLIEFFLPFSLLSEPIHLLELIEDNSASPPVLLEVCLGHQVVVRSVDRALSVSTGEPDKNQAELWRDKSNRLKEQKSSKPVHKLEPPDHTKLPRDQADELWRKKLVHVFRNVDTLCFAETRPFLVQKNLTEEVLRRAINAGLLAGVWLRTDIPPTVYHELDILVDGPLHELPARITKRRKGEDENVLREPLILFWDPYECLPDGFKEYLFGE